MSDRERSGRLAVIIGCLMVFGPLAARAATPLPLQAMAGTWDVQEWMWPAPGAQRVDLPPAIAHRRLIGGHFIQEIMTALPGSKSPFSRISYFDYNAMNGQYEYFSIDTRLPQMMNERSRGPTDPAAPIELYGGTFVAPQWGSATNVPFRYRLVLYPIRGNRQTADLYLTPMPAGQSAGFLAFKYIYTRRSSTR